VRILTSMSRYTYDNNDIIYALASAWGNSPIAVIRVSGDGSIKKFSELFSASETLLKAFSHTIHYGKIIDPDSKEAVDEILVAIFRDGRSYTGQESLEINCHGNIIGIEAIFKVLEKQGFRSAYPGEFTFRAFMNGKVDLTQAEAVMEIVNSQSEIAHSLALKRLEGNLFNLINEIKIKVVDALAVIELQLDYEEDEIIDETHFPKEAIEGALKRVESLLDTYTIGRLYSEGCRVVLAGSTNTGKSTLFNLLLKEERSIVSEIHGTTRDYIEAKTHLEGIPISLYDTAGLRDSKDSIEQEGIRRTRGLIKESDLVLLVVDSSIDGYKLSPEEQILAKEEKTIVVCNKTDLGNVAVLEGSYPLSAKTAEGFKTLKEEIVKRLQKGSPKTDGSTVVIESARQKKELNRACEALKHSLEYFKETLPLDIIAVELNEALDALGSLSGEVTSEDILENIFSNFCVGK